MTRHYDGSGVVESNDGQSSACISSVATCPEPSGCPELASNCFLELVKQRFSSVTFFCAADLRLISCHKPPAGVPPHTSAICYTVAVCTFKSAPATCGGRARSHKVFRNRFAPLSSTLNAL
jgi:hypothetical protein